MRETILQGQIGDEITLASFKDVEALLINSPGGSLFEGLAMYDYVHGKDTSVGVIGVCASAATLPLIATEHRWGTPNSRYLIHNPSNMEFGDAEAMEKTAKALREEQGKALMLYVKHLSISKEEIQALMDKDEIIDAEEALRIGLIKEIRPLNGVADKPKGTDIKNLFTHFKMQININNEDMDNKEVKKELSSLGTTMNAISDMVKAVMKGLNKSPMNLVVQDVNGTDLDFGEEVETLDQIEVGTTATVDGQPAAGDYTIAGLGVVKLADGAVTEIVPEESENEETEALKTENAELKVSNEEIQNKLTKMTAERDAARSSLTDISNEFKDHKTQFEAFQNKFTEDKAEVNSTQKKTQERTKFSYKK